MVQICYILFLFQILTVHPQDKNIITVQVTNDGTHDVTRLEYEPITAQYQSLKKGKNRVYVIADANCKLTVVREKSAVLSETDLNAMNEKLSGYRLRYFYKGELITDCTKLNSKIFPLTVIKD